MSTVRRPSQRLEVAAAVLLREDGAFLLCERPAGKVYAGYWEFPGGKIEAGEAPLTALARELEEELGVRVEHAYPWITREYEYEHAAVRLRFFRVARWSGELHARESQRFAWQSTDAVTVSPLLPANAPILSALSLPPVYAISCAATLGHAAFLERLERSLAQGLKLVQVREPTFDGTALRALCADAVRLAHRHGARVVVNGPAELARATGADGVHLSAAALAQSTARPALELVGASCHDPLELQRAAGLGADFVVLGPLRPTPSHPDAPGIGWRRCAAWIDGYPLPVYALGGLTRADLETAWRSGAHGISMLRGAWT